MGSTFAGLVLAMLAIVLINVYRDYGPDGVRSWFSAKFLNRPTITARPSSSRAV